MELADQTHDESLNSEMSVVTNCAANKIGAVSSFYSWAVSPPLPHRRRIWSLCVTGSRLFQISSLKLISVSHKESSNSLDFLSRF